MEVMAAVSDSQCAMVSFCSSCRALLNIARETRAEIRCDCYRILRYLFTDYVVCVGKKDNAELHYNRI